MMVSADTDGICNEVLPHQSIYASIARHAELTRDEFYTRRDDVLSREDKKGFQHLLNFLRIMDQIQERLSDILISYRDQRTCTHSVKKAYAERMRDYKTRLAQYPIGTVVDASLALVVTLAQDSQTAQNLLRSISFYQLHGGVCFLVSPIMLD